jgi:hypothetical protein
VAGVRGTQFSLGADGSVECYESTGGGVILADASHGTPQTFVIGPGQFFNAGQGGGVQQLPPALLNELGDVFKALRTAYFAVVSFEHDYTQLHISPTTGKF